jgi:hypothetical protein
MTTHALVVGVALAAFEFSRSAVEAQEPADACALLQPAEIQALAGGAKVGAGEADSAAFTRACNYEWGTGGNVQSGRSILSVSISPISDAYPGVDPSLVQEGLLAKAKAGEPNTAMIAGIGDAAIYESDDPIRVSTTAVAKGNMLIVKLESADARAKKVQVIVLLKAAAGRLWGC